MQPVIINDISKLSTNFRKKFDWFWAEVIAKYPHAIVFETFRTQERQNRLYGIGRTHSLNRKPVTRTKSSMHSTGKAVDIVFRNNWKIEWIWPYDDLIQIWLRRGIRNLKPVETCHFEDDGTEYKNPYKKSEIARARLSMSQNSKLRHETKDERLRQLLHETNTLIRWIYWF